jgi:hypothetical protein
MPRCSAWCELTTTDTEAILVQKQALSAVAQQAGLSGRKALVQRLRQETAEALIQCDASRAEQWQQQLASLQ